MPTRRQKRKEVLISYGFLPSEAIALSKISKDGLKVPYVRNMLLERKKLLDRATKKGLSKEEYRILVKKLYAKHGVLEKDPITHRIKRNKDGTPKTSIWKLLKKAKDDYEKYNPPAPKSPWRMTRANRAITNKRTKFNQAIKKHQAEIEYYKGRLGLPIPDDMRKRYQTIIDRHENKIEELKNKAGA